MGMQPRRKKTNAEIKTANRAREQQRQLQQNSLAWDQLREIHKECSSTMQETAGSVAQVLRVPDLGTRLGENEPVVRRMAGEMARDVDTYAKTLLDIHDKYKDRKGLATGMGETMTAIALGEEYNQWTESFQNVVVQRANEILRIVEDTVDPIVTTPTDETTPHVD